MFDDATYARLRDAGRSDEEIRNMEQEIGDIGPVEQVAGFPLTRFALGAASPFLGATQRILNLAGQGEDVNQKIAALEEAKRRGTRYWYAQAGLPEMGEGIDWFGLGGTALSPPVAALSKIPSAATWLGKTAQAGAIGGAVGATMPVEAQSPQEQWEKAGVNTAFGVGAGILPRILIGGPAYLYRNIKPYLPGQANRMAGQVANLAAGKAPVLQELQAAPPPFPGVPQTAGQAAVKAGSPEFSALQREVETVTGAAKPYFDVKQAQEQAAKTALRSVGKTPADIEAAITARSGSAGQLYEAIKNMAVPADRTLLRLLRSPDGQKALLSAQKAVANDRAVNPFIAAFQKGKGIHTQFSVRGLHYTKQALDRMIENPSQFPSESGNVKAVTMLRDALNTWMDKNVAGWQQARTRFFQESLPINQMQIGQYLEQKLVAPLEEKLRPAAFAQAMREAPRTIQKATGSPRFEQLEDVLTPQQMQAVQSVGKWLEQQAQFERLAKAGGARRVAEEGYQAVGGGKVPSMLEREIVILNYALGHLHKGGQRLVTSELARIMQDPKLAAEAMQNASPRNRLLIARAFASIGDKLQQAGYARAPEVGALSGAIQLGQGLPEPPVSRLQPMGPPTISALP